MRNKIEIQSLKRGQRFYSDRFEDWFRVFSNPEFVDGQWQVDSTGSGDEAIFICEDDMLYDGEPDDKA